MKKSIFIILVVTFVVATLAVYSESQPTPESVLSNKKSELLYQPTESEEHILDILIEDDLNQLAQGGQSFFKLKIPSVSAGQIALTYDQNQVAADNQFYKKLIFITGQIQSINSGIGNEPYLTLHGTNLFLAPQVHFKKANIDKVATLVKNQTIYLVCTGGGSIAGTPMLKNCQFAKDYLLEKKPKIKTEIAGYLSGKSTTKNIAILTIGSIMLARELKPNSACFTNLDNGKCLKEIKSISAKSRNKAFKKIITELNSRGIRTPELKP